MGVIKKSTHTLLNFTKIYLNVILMYNTDITR